MPLYEFKCRKCGLRSSTMEYGTEISCPVCSIPKSRVYSFAIKSSFVPHYNTSVGKFVSSQSEFNSELRRLSDQQTERTGITHNYVSRELGDSAAFHTTEDGMDDFSRYHHDNLVPPETLV